MKFIYHNYKITQDEEKIYIEYSFEIESLKSFNPKYEILKKDFRWNHLESNIFKNLVFNLGMIESISYWKAVCCKEFVVECGYLEEAQQKWFRKLFFFGLGEFRYVNKISTSEEDFVEFKTIGSKLELEQMELNTSSTIVPIGGGKDSNVTLELLKDKQDVYPFLINPQDVSLSCIEQSGIDRKKVIEVNRILDRGIIELNEKGYLNGHTPFSSMVAFVSTLIAFSLDKSYIALSNENSANEANVDGENINHQYSKSKEFEDDFRWYSENYLKIKDRYFSFLRPISELQIAYLFSKYPKYHIIFKSCNVGSKQKPWIWCGECPKCLFVYTILSPFLEKEKLVEIFGSDLFEKVHLKDTFIELLGFGEIKPFECVGTYSEVRYAVSKVIEKGDKLPYLLQFYKDNYELESTDETRLHEYNSDNNLPKEFDEILRKAIL